VLNFFRDDEGQGLVEYALIIAVIAIAVIVAMIFLRGQLQNIFSNIGNNLTERSPRGSTTSARRTPGRRRFPRFPTPEVPPRLPCKWAVAPVLF